MERRTQCDYALLHAILRLAALDFAEHLLKILTEWRKCSRGHGNNAPHWFFF